MGFHTTARGIQENLFQKAIVSLGIFFSSNYLKLYNITLHCIVFDGTEIYILEKAPKYLLCNKGLLLTTKQGF